MSRIIGGLFNSTSQSERIMQGFRPAGFVAPSGTGSFNPSTNTYTLTRSPEAQQAIDQIVSGFRGTSNSLQALRAQVAPGFGKLSEATAAGMRASIEALRGTARRTVGNIRAELSRRRLAGSSFQASAVATAEAEFAKQEAQIRADAQKQQAEAFLQEIGLNSGLIQKQFDNSLQASAAILQQLNFDTSTIAALTTSSSQLMQANLQAQAEARASQQQAGEDFLGTLIGAWTGGGGLGEVLG